MGERVPISTRKRFEIFKRDAFSCQYCGKSPPAVVLEIDHIIPVFHDGTNETENLITACFDCNRGKSCIPLDQVIPSQADKIERLKEKEAQLREFNSFLEEIENRLQQDFDKIDHAFNTCYADQHLTEHFRNTSLRTFLKLMPVQEIIEMVYLAYCKVNSSPSDTVKYFCGIFWKTFRSRKDE